MNENKKPKKEPWRIIIAILAVIFIVVMWVKKDIVSAFEAFSPDQILPVVATTVVVTLVKVAILAGAILFIKWLIKKIKSRHTVPVFYCYISVCRGGACSSRPSAREPKQNLMCKRTIEGKQN